MTTVTTLMNETRGHSKPVISFSLLGLYVLKLSVNNQFLTYGVQNDVICSITNRVCRPHWQVGYIKVQVTAASLTHSHAVVTATVRPKLFCIPVVVRQDLNVSLSKKQVY
jgi:hypothetical protein